MKPVLRLLLTAATACLFASSARADARDEIAQAIKAQNDAPAYRMKVSSTDNATKILSTINLESVKPDGLHMKQETGGKVQLEVFSDGKRTLMSQGAGPLQEAPAGMGAMIAATRKTASVEAMAQTARDVAVAGHESVNGGPATAYTFSTDAMGLQSASKLWVSDADHRPLKSESTVRGELQMGGQTVQKLDRTMTITYEYDPSIQIVLPPAK